MKELKCVLIGKQNTIDLSAYNHTMKELKYGNHQYIPYSNPSNNKIGSK